MKKRFLAVLMILVLSLSTLNGYSPVEAENALTEDQMTEVLIAVKGKLQISDDYTEFDYSYNEYSGEGTYQFTWRTEDGRAYIGVTADTTGRIYNLYSYDNNKNSEREGLLPNYIGEELIPKAEEWIARVEPDIKGKLNLKNCRYSNYNKTYSLSFVRNENGIDLNDNGVSIVMDAFDATVTNYRLNWDFTVKIPKVESPISKEAAAEKVAKKVNMHLEYRLTYGSDGNQKVFLAYNPDRTYVAVDAKNGKIYTEKVYWGSGTDFDGGFNDEAEEATAEESGSYDDSVKLSDAEIQKIGEIKDIISSEEAVKLIKNNKKLYIDQNLTSADCRLYSSNGEYYWRIYLSDNRPVNYDDYDEYTDYYRASLNASINAKTGKLISFSAYTKDYYVTEDGKAPFEIAYTKKQCQKIFEEFVKETDPDKFEYLELNNVYEQKVYIYNLYNKDTDYDKVGGYSYSYDRYYKDIPFTANGVYGAVEAITGKITNYNVNWTDAELPEPENLIGNEKAFESYISSDGFDLIYELVSKYEDKQSYYGYDKEVKARLVYRTAIYPNYIDAFTGKRLSWNGEEYKPVGVSYKYTDINGTKYERSIKLLADMGYGFDGEEFNPDAKITNAEFEKILGASGYSVYYYNYPTYYADVEEGEEEVAVDNENTVTRQEAACLIISRMGGDKLAKMDIYKTGYSDENKIDKENIGYVALCKGLGIMGAKSGNKFKPKSAVTRGEAADLIIRMLSTNF
ncbi:MAG: S-layer homology domain-containing protein [Lachnospiraceae bacterium]|nr:S-layer homology domain-containing protein [Lachnospiraceae bacterium]